MTLQVALIALFVQVTLAGHPPAAKASATGVVVNDNTGEPVANVRVSLARLDVSLGSFAHIVAAERPPVEMTIPGDALAAISDEIESEARDGRAPPEAAAASVAMKALALSDIHEIIVNPTAGMAVVSKSSPPTMTDELGRFTFNDVEPGTYRLIFARNGYASHDYRQRTQGGGGVPLMLVPGQAKTDIVVRMAPVGAVGGHIRDAAGQPIAGVPVQLVRFSYDDIGQKQLQRIASTLSDDRGEYRMYSLSPGRYYLSAGHQAGQTRPGDLTSQAEALFFGAGYSSANRISQSYGLTYYPGVADQNSATGIDVQPGADLTGIDMFMGLQQSYRVRGRVVDSKTGQPPQSVAISIVQTGQPLVMPSRTLTGGNSNYKGSDGTFEMQGVSPGEYTIFVSLANRSSTPSPDLASMSPGERTDYFESMTNARLAQPRASTTINVVNADVDGVALLLAPSSSISGRIRVDANAPYMAAPFDFLRVQLKTAASVAVNHLENGAQSRPVAADGTFRIENVLPGEYRLSWPGLPPGFYVKEARLGEADLLNGTLRYSGSDSNTLDILISPTVGAINLGLSIRKVSLHLEPEGTGARVATCRDGRKSRHGAQGGQL